MDREMSTLVFVSLGCFKAVFSNSVPGSLDLRRTMSRDGPISVSSTRGTYNK